MNSLAGGAPSAPEPIRGLLEPLRATGGQLLQAGFANKDLGMRYFADVKRVSHDRLQDEVIIINVASGAYYSGSGSAADLWTLVTAGASLHEAAHVLAAAYGAPEETIKRDLETSVVFLVERGLLQTDDAPASKSEFTLPPGTRTAWRAPEFDEYTDMWELIKLDPIHEVEDIGWPVRKA